MSVQAIIAIAISATTLAWQLAGMLAIPHVAFINPALNSLANVLALVLALSRRRHDGYLAVGFCFVALLFSLSFTFRFSPADAPSAIM